MSAMNNLVGQTLGQYEIIKLVGQGGMATVFQARQPGLNRDVALKVLPPNIAAQPGFTERFIREAQAIGNLNHPNILPVYDTGRDKGFTYIAMRYIPNATTLADTMRETLAPAQITRLTGQIASALDLAHRSGIIHRDVKPSNVLMDGDWALLSDFGLAKMMETPANLTGSGVGLGTPAYMSPEQAKAEAVDHRTDLYALAVIVYEMLTGQVPHKAETPLGTVVKRLSEPIIPPRKFNPAIPPAVEAVLLKALSLRAQDRQDSAGQFARELEAAFAAPSAPVSPPPAEVPPSPPVEPPPLPPALPAQSGGLGAMEIALLALLGGMAFCGLSGAVMMLANWEDKTNLAMLPVCLSLPFAGLTGMVMLWLRNRTGGVSGWVVSGLVMWVLGIFTLAFGVFVVFNPGDGDLTFMQNFAYSTALCLMPGGILALLGLLAYGYDFRRRRTGQPLAAKAVAPARQASEDLLNQKLRRAAEYRRQIDRLIKQKQGRTYAAQLAPISANLSRWENHLRQLVARVQKFQANPLLQHDLQEVPQAISRLQGQLEREPETRMRQEIGQALASYQAQQTQLERLTSLIRRTELDIDETLGVIGAIYSQLQMLEVKELDNNRATRLSADLAEQNHRLGDLLAAMDEVYQEKGAKGAAL